jgi:hypothetical protein
LSSTPSLQARIDDLIDDADWLREQLLFFDHGDNLAGSIDPPPGAL